MRLHGEGHVLPCIAAIAVQPLADKAGLPACQLAGILRDPYLRNMKMTFELPPDLVMRLKLRAARDGAKLKDLIAEACRGLLAEEARPRRRKPGKGPFPVIKGGRPAATDAFSPGRVDELLWGNPR